MKSIQKNLGDILMESGIVTEAEIKEAIRRQRTTGRRLGVELCEMGLCTAEDVERALAVQFAMPFMRLTPGQMDREAATLISPELAIEGTLVPTWAVGETVHVVMADPTDEDVMERLIEETGGQVQVSLGVPSEIRQAIRVVYGSETSGPPPAARFESTLLSADETRAVNEDDSGRTFVRTLLTKASAASCRGILLEPAANGGGRIRFRSATDWREVATCSRDWYLEVEAQLERLGRVQASADGHLKSGRLPQRDVGGGELIQVWEQHHGRVVLITPSVETASRRAVEFADPDRAMATLTSSAGVIMVDSSPLSLALAVECLVAAVTAEGHTMLVAQTGHEALPEALEPGSVLRFPSRGGNLDADWQTVRDLPFDWVLLGNADDGVPTRLGLDLCLRRKRLATSLTASSARIAAARLLEDGPAEAVLPELALLHVVAVPILCRDCRQQITVPAPVLVACRLGETTPVFTAGGCPSCNGVGITGERILGEAVRLADIAAGEGERPGSVGAWLHTLVAAGDIALADYLCLTGHGRPGPDPSTAAIIS